MELGTLLEQNHIFKTPSIQPKYKRFNEVYEMMSLMHQVPNLDSLIFDCARYIVTDDQGKKRHWNRTDVLSMVEKLKTYDNFTYLYEPVFKRLNSRLNNEYTDAKISSIWADIVRIQNKLQSSLIANK